MTRDELHKAFNELGKLYSNSCLEQRVGMTKTLKLWMDQYDRTINSKLEEENNNHALSTAEKYPVLSNYEFDPSLLLAFKEEQMRYFCFLPAG